MKVFVDVPATRRHWYPKYLFFPSPIHWNDCLIALRTTLGQEICDAAIESGVAIPIPSRHNAVADAMDKVPHLFPDYELDFFRIFAHPENHPGGWEEFLAIVAGKQARFFAYRHTAASNHVETNPLVIKVTQIWKRWYGLCRKDREANCNRFGFEFLDAIKETEQVSQVLCSGHVTGVEISVQL